MESYKKRQKQALKPNYNKCCCCFSLFTWYRQHTEKWHYAKGKGSNHPESIFIISDPNKLLGCADCVMVWLGLFCSTAYLPQWVI